MALLSSDDSDEFQYSLRSTALIKHLNRTNEPSSPYLSWSSLQTLLETAIPHVLIILDCCYAANAARDLADSRTTKELLAACSRESTTSGVGYRSYTRALIDELENMSYSRSPMKPFSAAMLHSRLMSVRWRLAYTPTYALLSELGGSSIVLNPKPRI